MIMHPREHDYLFGHKEIEKKLIEIKEVHPAWIITGSYGVGKETLAYKWIRKLLLTDLNTNDSVFMKIKNQIHPDFLIINKNDNSIKAVREIIQKIHQKPVLSQRMVLLINDIDSFNRNSLNALLKLLENPPKNSVIIMLSVKYELIPATLRSRCYRIHLKNLENKDMEKGLSIYLPELNQNEITTLIKLSNGSLGFAINFHKLGGIEFLNELTQGKINLKSVIADKNTLEVCQLIMLKILHQSILALCCGKTVFNRTTPPGKADFLFWNKAIKRFSAASKQLLDAESVITWFLEDFNRFSKNELVIN